MIDRESSDGNFNTAASRLGEKFYLSGLRKLEEFSASLVSFLQWHVRCVRILGKSSNLENAFCGVCVCVLVWFIYYE